MRLCSVEGCGAKHRANGFCEAHNRRFKRGLLVHVLIHRHEYRHCAVAGCGVKSGRKPYCTKHERRWLKHGDPLVVGKAGRPKKAA